MKIGILLLPLAALVITSCNDGGNADAAKEMRIILEDTVTFAKKGSETLDELQREVSSLEQKLEQLQKGIQSGIGQAGRGATSGDEESRREGLEDAAAQLQAALKKEFEGGEVIVYPEVTVGLVSRRGVDGSWMEVPVYFSRAQGGDWQPVRGVSGIVSALRGRPAEGGGDAKEGDIVMERDGGTEIISTPPIVPKSESDGASWLKRIDGGGFSASDQTGGEWHTIRGQRRLVPRSMLPVPDDLK